MAPVAHEVAGRRAARLVRPAGAVGTLLALLLGGGCVTTGHFGHKEEGPPVGEVCQAVAYWANQVAFSPDPVNQGRQSPVLRGRLYLFGRQIDFPRTGGGSVVVELFDATPNTGRDPNLPLEVWEFDADTLRQRCLSRDMIGWGYNLFLPWGTYRPEISTVRLRVCYQPPGGLPIYTDNPPMTLSSAADTHYTARTISPPAPAGQGQAPGAAAAAPKGEGGGLKPVSITLPAKPGGR